MSRASYGVTGRFDGLGLRAGPRATVGDGLRGDPLRADGAGRDAPTFGRYRAASYGALRFETRYRSGITQISAEARPVPHPPADSPVRAGSIREDVARYNEERAAFRPLARGSAGGGRPPMPSPYRN